MDENLAVVVKHEETCEQLSEQVLCEAVTEEGDHSNAKLTDQTERGIRTYISEPYRGRRHWQGRTDAETARKLEARDAVYGNRHHIKGAQVQALMRKHAELVKRSFAHGYDTSGMRRTRSTGRKNFLKRLLIHVAGFNLSGILG